MVAGTLAGTLAVNLVRAGSLAEIDEGGMQGAGMGPGHLHQPSHAEDAVAAALLGRSRAVLCPCWRGAVLCCAMLETAKQQHGVCLALHVADRDAPVSRLRPSAPAGL